MIFKALDSIRKKPSHIRSLYAIGASLSITFVVGFFWYVSYSAYVKDVFSKIEGEEVAVVEDMKTNKGFFNKFKSSVSSAFGQLKGEVSELSSLVISPTATSGASTTPAVTGEMESYGQTSSPGPGTGLQYSATSTGSTTENLIEYGTSTRGTSTSNSI